MCGKNLVHIASINNTLFSLAENTISSNSPFETAIGWNDELSGGQMLYDWEGNWVPTTLLQPSKAYAWKNTTGKSELVLNYYDLIVNQGSAKRSAINDNQVAKKQMTNGGGIVCFELKGGLEAGKTFLNNLKMLSLTANLGDTRSIASHPASTTHAKLSEAERLAVNITPGLIRISVGLEHRDDILADITGALAAI